MTHVYFNKELPFSYYSSRFFDTNDKESLSVLVKGIFKIQETGRLLAVRDKPNIVMKDLYNGTVNQSSIKYESDLAPFKPKTDLTFDAVARSPEAKELKNWPVRFDVDKRLSYGFHVQGKRQFEPLRKAGKREWRLSDSAPITQLPLLYEFAFGGTVPLSEDDVDSYNYNPIGLGFVSDYVLAQDEPLSAPQIGSIAELNAMKIGESIIIHGCGPITKSWLPRLALAGTLDEAWLRERHPLMPKDFDYCYWNAAPLPLQISPYLLGNEVITVRGCLHDPRPYSFSLPGAGIGARVRRAGQTEIQHCVLNLDTVHCDIVAEKSEEHRVTLIWRVVLDDADSIDEIVLHLRGLNNETSQEDPAAKVERESRENERARQLLIEQNKKLKTMMKASELSENDIRLALSFPPIGHVSGKMASILYMDTEKKIPIVVPEGSKIPIHIGKSGYIYNVEEEHDGKSEDSFDPDISDRKINDEVIIYVRLLDEPLDVWRPVKAIWHGGDCYFIHIQQPPHMGENWEFKPNERVVCQLTKIGNNLVLVATQIDKTHW
jgi:Uncharacterized protein conserved in bacteria